MTRANTTKICRMVIKETWLCKKRSEKIPKSRKYKKNETGLFKTSKKPNFGITLSLMFIILIDKQVAV